MNDASATIPTADQPQSVDEFLGTSTKPRWRRWAKYWIPGLIVLLLIGYFFNNSGDDKPDYITEAVTAAFARPRR